VRDTYLLTLQRMRYVYSHIKNSFYGSEKIIKKVCAASDAEAPSQLIQKEKTEEKQKELTP
jgi:hypothetical protein